MTEVSVKQYDIVISHASDADESLCLKIREELVDRGYSVFMDVFGQYPNEKMAAIIKNAHFFIMCLTKAYMQEKGREKDCALNCETKNRLTIQIAFLEDMDKTTDDILYLIGRGLYADFHQLSFKQAFAKILQAIQCDDQRKKHLIGCEGKWLGFNSLMKRLFSSKKTSVMISYCWQPVETRELCRKICERLTHEGYSAWIDVDKMCGNIEAAASGGVKDACCFIACLCDTYAESNECSKEISYASLLWRKEQIHFLPLIVPGSQGKTVFDMAQFVSEKTDKNGIDWIDLDKVQKVDFASEDFEVAFDKLLKALELYQIPKKPSEYQYDPPEDKCSIEHEERLSLSSCGSAYAAGGDRAVKVKRFNVEHDNMSVMSGVSDVNSEFSRDLAVKMSSSLSISNVITATKSWPSLDGSGSDNITDCLVYSSDQSVVILASDKGLLLKYALNAKGKYEQKIKSIKGFTTKPISICQLRPKSSAAEQIRDLLVLERTKDTGTILFTCSDGFGDKCYLGSLKETSFVVTCNPVSGLVYMGMSAGNILEVDVPKATSGSKTQTDELTFNKSITIASLSSVNILAVDNYGLNLFAADNCGKIIAIYNLGKNQVIQQIDLNFSPNDLLIDESSNLITLMRTNMFEVYSPKVKEGQLQDYELSRSQKLKEIPQENFMMRHLDFINPNNGPHSSILVCTGHGKTSKIDYAAASLC
ncbi:uncharacterized protein LOC142345668 isoform X2 [Convolutriloba macropyga]|uniref:uncharacterized protein LOC142345668 isoform X2 n=1 Tax=Convolutriloba macropyga TaxID=536237 RepID=UPI003F5256D5